jgi:hypothetical protein
LAGFGKLFPVEAATPTPKSSLTMKARTVVITVKKNNHKTILTNP